MKKVILITGTSRGIGNYLAGYYLGKGFDVIGCSRKKTEFLYEHENYTHFYLDVTDEVTVKKMFFDIKEKYKKIDILINNVGTASMNHVILTPLKTVEDLYKINFESTFLLTQEAVKIMMQNKFGRIINFTTVAVPLFIEGEAVYASVKSAIETFTKVVAKEVGHLGITCNAVGPTPIKTDLIKNVPKDKIKKITDRLAIKRLGRFEDVSNIVDFFIDDKSEFVTGQIIYMGGVS